MLIRRGHAVHVSVVFALVLHYTCHPGCWDCRRSCVSDLSSSPCWFGVDTILPTTESPTFSFHLRQNLTGRVSLRDNSADSFFDEPLFGKAALLLLLDLSIFPVITGVAHLVSRSSAANVSLLTTLIRPQHSNVHSKVTLYFH